MHYEFIKLSFSPPSLVELNKLLCLSSGALWVLRRRAAVDNSIWELGATEFPFKEKWNLSETFLYITEIRERRIREDNHKHATNANIDCVTHIEAFSPRVEAVAWHILPSRKRRFVDNLLSSLYRVLQFILGVSKTLESNYWGIEKEERAIDSLRPIPHLISQLLNVLVLQEVNGLILTYYGDHISSFEICVSECESSLLLFLLKTHNFLG